MDLPRVIRWQTQQTQGWHGITATSVIENVTIGHHRLDERWIRAENHASHRCDECEYITVFAMQIMEDIVVSVGTVFQEQIDDLILLNPWWELMQS